MSESPGKHQEMQEIRAEISKLWRSCSPAKRAKESQTWLNIMEKELPPFFFLSKMAKKKKVAICQQKVPPGSRVWADNLNGKGGLPGLVMLS